MRAVVVFHRKTVSSSTKPHYSKVAVIYDRSINEALAISRVDKWYYKENNRMILSYQNCNRSTQVNDILFEINSSTFYKVAQDNGRIHLVSSKDNNLVNDLSMKIDIDDIRLKTSFPSLKDIQWYTFFNSDDLQINNTLLEIYSNEDLSYHIGVMILLDIHENKTLGADIKSYDMKVLFISKESKIATRVHRSCTIRLQCRYYTRSNLATLLPSVYQNNVQYTKLLKVLKLSNE